MTNWQTAGSLYNVMWISFKTRWEAIDHLTAPFNSKGAETLRWVKGESYPPTPKNDAGAFDVLSSFAASLGYKVVHKDFSQSRSQKDLDGRISYIDRIIFVSDREDRATMADILAHEIAHHFEYAHLEGMTTSKREHLVQAVACAIMRDFGLDTRHMLRCYLWAWRRKTTNFLSGQLDKEFLICYHNFSRELTAFLRAA